MVWKLLCESRMSSFTETRSEQTGTKEWSDKSYNICLGCEHGCLYCFARSIRCWSDEAMRQPGAWQAQRLNPNRSRLGAEVRHAGVVMFPSSHDITPAVLPEAVQTIRNLLETNEVLIVSKPHFQVVRRLCSEFADNRRSILFRFTIGALDRKLCSFWEPGAPSPAERIRALAHAFEKGFATSVSCEPFLDTVDKTCDLVRRVAPLVTDTIWVGKARRVARKLNAHVPGFLEALQTLRASQTDTEVLRLVNLLSKEPKVRWKDSIRAVLAKAEAQN
jgi:DNA repair photolyase